MEMKELCRMVDRLCFDIFGGDPVWPLPVNRFAAFPVVLQESLFV